MKDLSNEPLRLISLLEPIYTRGSESFIQSEAHFMEVLSSLPEEEQSQTIELLDQLMDTRLGKPLDLVDYQSIFKTEDGGLNWDFINESSNKWVSLCRMTFYELTNQNVRFSKAAGTWVEGPVPHLNIESLKSAIIQIHTDEDEEDAITYWSLTYNWAKFTPKTFFSACRNLIDTHFCADMYLLIYYCDAYITCVTLDNQNYEDFK